MSAFGHLAKILSFAALLYGTSIAGALAGLPEDLSKFLEKLERQELTEVRVYSSQSLGGGFTLYEIVPDENYVVHHPKIMCADGVTAQYANDLADAFHRTIFTAEPHKYAVDWVLQFYDGNGVERMSILMGTGGSGDESASWHVEVNEKSFVADGPIRSWLMSNYPHVGCTRFDLSNLRRRTHGN